MRLRFSREQAITQSRIWVMRISGSAGPLRSRDPMGTSSCAAVSAVAVALLVGGVNHAC